MTNSLSKRIVDVLQRRDNTGMHAVGRALVHLYNRQTADEQMMETTNVDNGRGFTVADGMIGSSMAKFYMRRGYLTPKQLAHWQSNTNCHGEQLRRPRITKYWKQLCEEAIKKQKEA